MKPTSEILERITKCSSDHKDGVFTRLYRYLLREEGIIGLLISFGSLIVAFLTFLDKRNSKKK